MAKAKGSINIISDAFGEDVNRIWKELTEGPPIRGGLTVDGHSYWVVLEYGSSPKSRAKGWTPDDPIILPPGIPEQGKHHEKWYPIRARRRERLSFYKDGKHRAPVMVFHPGNISRSFIRRIINKTERNLSKALESLSKQDTLPSRKELVTLFNSHLMFMLEAVQNATPEGPDEKFSAPDDPDHQKGPLRDAWGVVLARIGPRPTSSIDREFF